MSQPIPRYRIDRFTAYGFTDDANGKFCEYRDYAALAAENERLKQHAKLDQQTKWDLLAENERLRKAGDEMAGVIGLPLNKTQTDAHISAWNASKEGGRK